MPAYQYPVNPQPQAGAGTFGAVPGPVSLPSPATDLAQQIPGLAGLTGAASGTIMRKLGGSISPATQAALQDAAARYGMQIGQPGMSPMAYNQLFGNIAGFAESQSEQALQDYSRFVPTVSATQTVSPELQARIAEQNALQAAAPTPSMAQSHAEQLFANYLAAMRGGGRQPFQPAGITRGQISSGFGTPDQVYYSTGQGEWYGGGSEYRLTPPDTSVPTGSLSAGGPGYGSGQAYMGPSEGYTPEPPSDIASMSDEDLMDYITGMGGG